MKLFLRTLGAVFGAALVPLLYAGCVKSAAYDGVTYTGQVFYTTATYKYDGVFLKVVAFTRDVANHLDTIHEANFGYFTECGVWLFRRRGVHTGAYAALLRAGIERSALARILHLFAAFPHKLIDGWHTVILSENEITRSKSMKKGTKMPPLSKAEAKVVQFCAIFQD